MEVKITYPWDKPEVKEILEALSLTVINIQTPIKK